MLVLDLMLGRDLAMASDEDKIVADVKRSEEFVSEIKCVAWTDAEDFTEPREYDYRISA